MLVKYTVEEHPQPLYLSREDLVSRIDGAAQRNGSNAKGATRRNVQIVPKLLNGLAKVNLDALDRGRSFARNEELDVISGEV